MVEEIITTEEVRITLIIIEGQIIIKEKIIM